MNQKVFAVFIFILTASLAACSFIHKGTTPDSAKLIEQTDRAYIMIRAVILDPNIEPFVPAEYWPTLAALEVEYLECRTAVQEGTPSVTIAEVLSISERFLSIVKEIPALSEHSDRIARASAALKIAREILEPG